MKNQEIKVKCQICGVEKEHLHGHINRVHNLTKKQYQSQFPGCLTMSKHFLDVMSKSHKGNVLSPEHKMKIKLSLTNNPKIKSRGNNIHKGAGRKGTPTSRESRLRMRLGKLGTKQSIIHRANISNGLRRYLQNEENRAKRILQAMSALKNHPHHKCGWMYLENLKVNVYYRSSFEKKAYLILNSRFSEIADVKFEKLQIPYLSTTSKYRHYVPDVYLTLKNGKRFVIEIKPSDEVSSESVEVKVDAGTKWCLENNAIFCVWTEKVIFSDSSTTMLLEEILMATATYQNGIRYSLNSQVTERGKEKSLARLCS